MEDRLRTIKFLLDGLEDVQRWALVGAVAMHAWIPPRQTNDVDFMAYCGDLDASKRAMQMMEFRLAELGWSQARYTKEDVCLDWRLRTTVEVKLLGEPRQKHFDVMFVHQPFQHQVLESARVIRVFGDVELPVAGPEGLVVLKLTSGRGEAQDRIDAERLLAEAQLDTRLLARLVTAAGVQEKFNTVAKKAGWQQG
jgi:predicted nucleotidyltransferase